MRADTRLRSFGWTDDEDADEPLPFLLESRKFHRVTVIATSSRRDCSHNTPAEDSCQVLVDVPNGETTLSSWYEIWEAVTAVASMCVRNKNKGGSARGLGK